MMAAKLWFEFCSSMAAPVSRSRYTLCPSVPSNALSSRLMTAGLADENFDGTHL